MSKNYECDCQGCSTERRLDTLIASVLYLMSRYARERNIYLIRMVEEHLLWICEHPETAQYPSLQKTCERLALGWHSMKHEHQLENADLDSDAGGKQILH